MSLNASALSRKKDKASSRWQRFSLLTVVFCGGVVVMGLEMTASQLIAPYFGSTISVWTSLIGLVMIFLTTGYYLGGALADRRPSRVLLGFLVLSAGIFIMLTPLVSIPVLQAAWRLTPKIGLLGGALVGTFVLFSVPNILLGCICPFAMKLSIQDLEKTGRASGNVYAVSAVGSVVGTFLPVLITIELLGVRRSIMLFGALLIAAAIVIIIRARVAPLVAALLLLGAGASVNSADALPPLLPIEGLLEERESPYNYLQVIQSEETRLLIVDWGAFSFYTPGKFRTGRYYDYLMMAPLMRHRPPNEWLKKVLIIGLGAGTISKQATDAFGPIEIDGVEIDHEIIALGQTYFDMNEPNLRIFETDGRAFLATSGKPYDWAVIDAYQGAEIPSHLVTEEFFELLRSRMSPQGVVSINVAWWEPEDSELLERLVATMREVFPSVCAITGITGGSAVLLAGVDEATPRLIMQNARAHGHPGLLEIAEEISNIGEPEIEFPLGLGPPLTDDSAALNKIVDRMYLETRRETHDLEKQFINLR